MTAPQWPEDARTIIEWARGGTVSIDRLVAEFEDWSNHFAPTAALWEDATAERGQVQTGDCERDCQEQCAYPGRFSECDIGAAG